MITRKTLRQLHRLHSRRPASVADLNLTTLAVRLSYISATGSNTSFANINDESITFNSISANNPIHNIPTKNICGIEYLNDAIAIIMLHCIILINQNNGNIKLHLSSPKLSLFERLKLTLRYFTPATRKKRFTICVKTVEPHRKLLEVNPHLNSCTIDCCNPQQWKKAVWQKNATLPP